MSSLIPHDYRYKISSPTPVDKEPKKGCENKTHNPYYYLKAFFNLSQIDPDLSSN